MTTAEDTRNALARERRRTEDKAAFRTNLDRLAAERHGMTEDAYVARFDDPEKEPMIA